MATEPFTRDIFVGRQAEQTEFHALLRQDCAAYQVYHLYGGGGMGKTRLLEWMIHEAQQLDKVLNGSAEAAPGSALALTAQTLRAQGLQHIRLTADLVDFFKTGVHTPLGLLKDIARQLGLFGFVQFSEELEAKGIDPSRYPEEMEKVHARFLAEYRSAAEHAVMLLLFDTFEGAGWAGENLLAELLPGLGPHTLMVVVGREKVTFPDEGRVIAATLAPLTAVDAVSLFRRRGLPQALVTDAQIEQITALVRGRPIYLALAADWIADAEGTVDELVRTDPAEDLGRALVRRTLRLKIPEDKAILYLAVIWRLGNPGLLAHLLQITLPETEVLIDRLGRFSFIKYHAPAPGFSGSCVLHDEMRDLVLQHCWPEFDRTGQQMKALTRSALDYYEKTLYDQEGPEVAAGRQRARASVMRNYQAEWLYYQLRLDLRAGAAHLERLFRDAAHHRDMSFCQQLLDEFRRPEFWNRLSEAEQADADFKQGLILYRREKYVAAQQWWARVLGPNPVNTKMRATSLMMLTEMCSDQGLTKEGLEYANQAEAVYRALLQEYPGDDILRRELGELYNNRGRLLRIHGDLSAAIEYYDKALDIYQNLPKPKINKGRARTLNNLGYIYYQQGDMQKARDYCNQALQLRRGMDFKYELGLSYNTMGMVLEAAGDIDKARKMYREALETFDADHSNYGRGLVLVNLGRLHRFAQAYPEALEDLESAREIFARLGNRDNLSETLNELGCVYRARRAPGDIQQAEKMFRQSIETASSEQRMVDNWIDLATMYAEAGQRAEVAACLAEARPRITRLGLSYFQGEAYEIEAHLGFEETEKLEQAGQAQAASAAFQAACENYLQALAAYADSMQRASQYQRAERRYRSILDDLAEKLQARPAAELIPLIDSLKTRWGTIAISQHYHDLITRCDDLLAIGHYSSSEGAP